jgi:hypothetical protein
MSYKLGALSKTQLIWILTSISFVTIAPSLFLLSPDDIAVYMNHDRFADLAAVQAQDGRFCYAAVLWLLGRLNCDYQSFIAISALVYSAALTLIYITPLDIAEEQFGAAALLGFCVFITFGLSLEAYSFGMAYPSYAAALFAGAVASRIAASRQWAHLPAIFVSAVSLTVGLGFYQIIVQFVVYIALACVLLLNGRHSWRENLLFAFRLGASVIIAALAYLAINGALKYAGFAWIQNYPARSQSFAYIAQNLPEYFRTIAGLLHLAGAPYGILLPAVVIILIAGVFATVAALDVPQSLIASALCLSTALLIVPNPMNLLLAVYWPSARSLYPIALFVGLASFVAARTNPGRQIVFALIIAQVTTMILDLRARSMQLDSDMAVARTLVLKALEQALKGRRPEITLGVSWRDVSVAEQMPYTFGLSMFGTRWSATAFVKYVGGDEVDVKLSSPEQCKSEHRLEISETPMGVLACFAQ